MYFFRSFIFPRVKCGNNSSRMKSDYLTAMNIRQQFLDYFSHNNHLQIRSSRVKPLADPTLEFINAGMNQFKNVFLGIACLPPSKRVANSQKCIRIGGKHNDLNSVGYDTYHHTFFEMLGNWSFGDYFKADACKYAYELITSEPYSLDPGRLYVTYFGGDLSMSLPADLETKEIWREIGISKDRIIPFGTKDNFWEMGSSGPCGPCTEIHYDHLGTKTRSNLVNTDLPDLTELWNLVFIQYNKLEEGDLIPLKQNFVDTGMGLERLTAILQGKRSNYDTDLFTPLFHKISKCSKLKEYEGKFGTDDHNEIDTHYRILADHIRMVTISIADNIFPDESHGLRRVIRKTLLASEKFIPGKGINLVLELAKVVGDILGPVYPEITTNFKQIKSVLINEEQLWKQVQSNVKEEWKKILAKNKYFYTLNEVQSNGLISAIRELDRMNYQKGSVLNSEFALVLYDRYGLTAQVIEELARINGYSVDSRQLEIDIIKLKEKNKSMLYSSSKLDMQIQTLNNITSLFKPTDDSYKYCYTRDEKGFYNFTDLTAEILCILSSGKILQNEDELKRDTKVAVLLDRTNFWAVLKGDSDIGKIILTDKNSNNIGYIEIDNAVHHGSYVIHNGSFLSNYGKTYLSDISRSAIVQINSDRRLSLMKNNMASHLLTNVIKSKYVINVQTFINSGLNFTIKFSFYGQDVSEGDLMLMEHYVNIMINKAFDISLSQIMNYELNMNNLYIPLYFNTSTNPVPLINFKYGSSNFSEVTTGPIVFNSKDIGEFCLVNIELNKKKRECIVKALTGENVDDAYNKTGKLLDKLNKTVFSEKNLKELEELKNETKTLVTKNLVPLSMKIELNHLVNNLNEVIKEKHYETKKSLMKEAISLAKCNQKPFIVHYSDKDSKLEKLTRLCQDLPVMVFAYNNGHLTGRCTVPESSKLPADVWMSRVTKKLGSQIHHYQGHNSNYVCGMKPLKLNISSVDNLVDEAKTYAELVASEILEENR